MEKLSLIALDEALKQIERLTKEVHRLKEKVAALERQQLLHSKSIISNEQIGRKGERY